ncbi:BamA/TamA family outer membrane protein [Sediminibacterium roseum]|uniref:BamA/TamA family outer membrane protein n=1 Tax=Sediminibacterium roseum TaxID=1978412 RepID=A0ABW9ZRB4_9BACT|nr:BamA/TamA family outer membrane protein [Sediminibacterium roseum]NCI49494.1 BamA/TamA family outer membrane protein [Sediminibacterium roseum]
MRLIVVILAVLNSFVTYAQEAAGVVIPAAPVKRRDTTGQTDLIDIASRLLKLRIPKPVQEERGKTIYFSLLPFNSSVPGGSGRALITSTTAATYFGPRRTTNLSSATFTPYWNFNGRFGLPLRTSVWLANNAWTIQGDMRFLVYPQYTWGVGGTRAEEEKLLVDYKYIRFHQAALKKITPYFFAGIGYNLDYHFNIKTEDTLTSVKQFTGYAYGTGANSFSSGISVNLLYDTRNNSINPLPGVYANLVYRVNPKSLGSNDSWHSLYLDIRKYISLNTTRPRQQNTLALWSYVWTVFNGNTPLLDLPGIGWDPYNRSGRGIDQNRYSGKTLWYFESEYRRDITQNGLFGFVVFANVNSVTDLNNRFTGINPAGGAGLRIKFNKKSRTNIGIDYGFSKDYRSIILNLGEAF